jgi:hypothetical protein
VVIHGADNAKGHKGKKCHEFLGANGVEQGPHPLNSPDLAPPDFSLFGHVKCLSKGSQIESPGELFAESGLVLCEITVKTSEVVSDEWIARLRWVILNEGQYFDKPQA